MKKYLLALAVAALAFSQIATADSRRSTEGYAGLNWSLGGSVVPNVVVGVFRVRVEADRDTEGANAQLHIDLKDGPQLSKFKLSYLNGKNDLQGEAGIGYNLQLNAPLFSFGLNAPYVNGAIDYTLEQGYEPNLTVHTQGKFDRPDQNQIIPQPPGGGGGGGPSPTLN